MTKGHLIIAGIGSGDIADMSMAVRQALQEADCVVGYKYYFQFVETLLNPRTERFATGMHGELERAREALHRAQEGKRVVMISSGDANIYGMGALVLELCGEEKDPQQWPEVSVLPGISAFQKAAALLGAPIGGDFCVISLSDLMTPWEDIERRIVAAAQADFVTCVYNPRSHERYWQLPRLRELFLREGRSADTPVGYVRQAGREEQQVVTTTLGKLRVEDIDMFCILLIGNSHSYFLPRPKGEGQFMVTRRGYSLRSAVDDSSSGTQNHVENPQTPHSKGQGIMQESFRTIMGELSTQSLGLGAISHDREHLWLLLHAIHTTADFSMQEILYSDKNAVARMYGHFDTIVTDVTMAQSGIRKGALQRLGIEAHCYLNDARTIEMAKREGITRSEAGIRLAVAEHPTALFAFGNAPTALMELCRLIRTGQAHPAGIIAAPVGFVHVEQSKYMVKAFSDIPKIIIEGRRGGSNLAATLCNAILTWPDAETLLPGRDV